VRGSGSGCGCRSIALGLAIHLFRDLAETGSGVAALWPLSDHSFSLAYGLYLTVMAGHGGSRRRALRRRPPRRGDQ